MVQVTLNNQTAALVKNGSESIIKLDQISTVKLDVTPDQIQKIERVGNNAIITLKNGEVITLENFYELTGSKVVLQEGANTWEIAGLESTQAGVLPVSYLPVETAVASSAADSAPLIDWTSLAAGVAAIGVAVAVNQYDHDNNNDTSPPAAGTLSVDGFVDTGSSSQDRLSKDNTFNLAVTGHEIGAYVQYQISTDGGKTWVDTTTAQTDLADGSYKYRAVVTDAAGNQSITNLQTVTVDTVAPVAGSLSLSNFADTGSSNVDGISQDKSFDLKLTGQESGAITKYQMSTDGGKTWVDTTVAQKDLADDSYQYRAVVTDAAGNQSITNLQTVIVDTLAPVAGTLSLVDFTDTGASNTDNISQDKTFNLNLAGQEAGSSVQYQISTDKGKTWVDTTVAQTNLVDGSYQYRAIVTDAAGNQSITNLQTVIVDSVAPVAGTLSLSNFEDTGSSNADGISQDKSFDLTLTGQEVGTTVQYQLSTDGGETWVNTTAAQTNIADGNYQYRAVVTDAAGNQSIAGSDVLTVQPSENVQSSGGIGIHLTTGPVHVIVDTQIDTTAIALTIDSVTADNIINLVESTQQQVITGSLSNLPTDLANYTLIVVVNGQSFAAMVDSATGKWTATVTGSDLFSTTQIDAQLQLTDTAGNQAQVESVKAYTINAVPEAPFDILTTTNMVDGTIVSGSAFAGSVINIQDSSGHVIATTITGADGTFVVDLPMLLSDGDGQTVTATVNDQESEAVASTVKEVPVAFVQSIDADGVVNGFATFGSVISIVDAQGNILQELQVSSVLSGSIQYGYFDSTVPFTLTLTRPLAEGEQVVIHVTKNAVEGRADSFVADYTPPAAATDVLINDDGSLITGHVAESDTYISIVDANGYQVGFGEVDEQGDFAARLYQPLHDGQTVSVVVIDFNQNHSPTVDVIAPDYALIPEVDRISAEGIITGHAEANSQITLTDASGQVLATGLTNSQGFFYIDSGNTFVDGQQIFVSAVNSKGQQSAQGEVVVDLIVPDAPTDITINDQGTIVTGYAEPNSQVKIYVNGSWFDDSYGHTNADGYFSVLLNRPLHDGQPINVSVLDDNGNISPVVTITAPEYAFPASVRPVGLDSLLNGTAENGSTIVVKDANGQEIATGGVFGGSWFPWLDTGYGTFNIQLPDTLVDGQQLSVFVVDSKNNVSEPVITTVDHVTPTVPVNVDLAEDGNTLTGEAEPYSTIRVMDTDSQIVGSGQVSGTGQFEFKLYNYFLKGETLTVITVDQAGNTSTSLAIAAPVDTTPPATAIELSIDQYGRVLTGVAEANSFVEVKNADGNVVGTTTVEANGTFTVNFYGAYVRGETLTVQVTDRADNHSLITTIVAPIDTIAPTIPTDLVINATNGQLLTGKAEAYSHIIIKDAAGNQVGDSYTNEAGVFSAYLYNVYLKGQTLTVVATDAAGNISPAATVTASIDNTAPLAATDLQVSADGSYLSGVAEVGSTIKVLDANGNQISTGYSVVESSDGSFNIYLYGNIYLHGEVLTVVVIDRAGNTSPTVTVTALIDNTAPVAATELVISADGSSLSGVAEAGATIRVLDADGNQLNYFNGVVSFDGTFNVAFYNNIFLKGEVLTVQVIDRAGNTSPTVTVTAPLDNTAPLAATELVISADGSSLSGVAEAGATIKILNAEGVEVYTGGTIVNADGTFTAPFYWDVYLKGQELTVQVVDRAGNTSPSVIVTAPLDNIAPVAAINLNFNADGSLTGQAEADTTVIVKTASGQTLGSTTVYDLVDFSIYNNFELQKGEEVFVTVVDRAGNTSPTVSITVPVDPNAPASATNLSISEAGNVLTGQATANSYIYIYDAQGQSVAYNVQVDSTGHFEAQLSQYYVQGETLNVFVYINNEYSVGSNVIAPIDTTPPLEPSYIWISDEGGYLTGIVEPINQVVVKNASGDILNTNTAIADSNGQFNAFFNPPLQQGQEIFIIVVDLAGNESTPLNMVVTPDIIAPNAATNLLFNADGNSLSGNAEPLSTIEITDQSGNYVGSSYTSPQGVFEISFYNFYLHNEVLNVKVIDHSGNVSPIVAVTAPLDDVAPLAATNLEISSDGSYLSGNAEAGAIIKVLNASGNEIYTGDRVANADGTFNISFYFNEVYLKGEVLTVQVIDRAGNESPAVTVTAPIDNTAPLAATDLVINGDGSYLSGVAEAGGTIRVWDAGGNPVSILYETVNPDGSFNVWFYNNIFLKGETLTVEVIDRAGNISSATSVTAPLDNIAPLAATELAISTDGSYLTGVAEPGAIIKILDTDGNSVNNFYDTVYSDGTFSTNLNNVYLKGQELTVIIVDRAGNESPATNVTAPLDDIAPLAATNLIFNENGYLIGDAEIGSTVIIKSVEGQQVALTTVYGADGFTIYDNFVLMQGKELFVTVVDRAGNVSPEVSITVPIDPNAPALATNLVISDDGLYLSGQATSGNYVHVYSENGDAISTYNWVDSTGIFNIPLYNHYLHGEMLKVYVSNSYSYSLASEVTAPLDNIAPDPVTNLSISDDGYWLTGLAEANTTVLIYNQQGNVAGEGVTDSAGNINLSIWNNFVAGEILNVVVVDLAGNFSSATTITVPDTSTTVLVTLPNLVPQPSDLMISYDGTYLSGKSEPSTYINVYKDDGSPVSLSNLVDDTGTFTIPLINYSNGDLLLVTASDAQGNASVSLAVTTTTAFNDTAQDTTTDPIPALVDSSAMLVDTDTSTSAVANGFNSSATTGSILNLADQAGLVFVANTGDQPIKPMQLDSLLGDTTNSGGVVIQIHSTGDQLTITSGDNIKIDSTAAVSNSVDPSSLASVPLSANSIDPLLNQTQLYL